MNELAAPRRRRTSPAVPSTFGGVAAVALRPAGCLLFWQCAVAGAAAIVIAWALGTTWARAFERATLSLGTDGAISEGRLEWPDTRTVVLFEDGFLSLVIDPEGRRDAGLASDVGISLEANGFAARSLLGWTSLRYPAGLRFRLNRVAASGWLAAWKIPALIGLGGAVFLGLFLSWWFLATLYGILLWAFGGTAGRELTFLEGWRLAGAALLPPAILMTAIIALYATRQLGMVGLFLAWPIHLVIGWIYCLGGLGAVPRPEWNAGTPFGAGKDDDTPRPASSGSNPFQSES